MPSFCTWVLRIHTQVPGFAQCTLLSNPTKGFHSVILQIKISHTHRLNNTQMNRNKSVNLSRFNYPNTGCEVFFNANSKKTKKYDSGCVSRRQLRKELVKVLSTKRANRNVQLVNQTGCLHISIQVCD